MRPSTSQIGFPGDTPLISYVFRRCGLDGSHRGRSRHAEAARTPGDLRISPKPAPSCLGVGGALLGSTAALNRGLRYEDERHVDSQGQGHGRFCFSAPGRAWELQAPHCCAFRLPPGLVGALRQELFHDVRVAVHCRNYEGCAASDSAASSPRARTFRDNRRCCPKMCSEGGGFGLDCRSRSETKAGCPEASKPPKAAADVALGILRRYSARLQLCADCRRRMKLSQP